MNDQATTVTDEQSGPGRESVALPSLPGILDGLSATVLHGTSLVKAGVALGAESFRIALGQSEVTPERGDWRFKDPAWTENAVYRRLGQFYLAWCAAVDGVLDDMTENTDWQRVARARFVVNAFTSAVAPTNTLLGNPEALKRTVEYGGANLVRGFGNFVDDVRHNGGMPSMSKNGALKVGEHLALTPGQVIDKDDVAELLQYFPSTETVHERPVLIVPPPIGRYYFLDLRPGRSFVEHTVSKGVQTFMLSWRNPTAEHGEWDIDTYAERILSALDAITDATGSPDVNIIGFCAGGILNTAVLNKLAASGDERIHSASYAVTLLDFGQTAPIGAFRSAGNLNFVRWKAGKMGITSARAMGSAFTWMRPNDLVWNYWVNNYLLGQDPPVFDILAWNADGTNLPGRLHQQFLTMFEKNPLPSPGAMTCLGEPVDLGTIKVPTFVVGAVKDHLTPWKSTYRTSQLLGGDSTYVLSNAGHIAALVNPPDNPKASYFSGPMDKALSADEWLEGATEQPGSWWDVWTGWVSERSGSLVDAPRSLGSERYPARAAAPGSYVRKSR